MVFLFIGVILVKEIFLKVVLGSCTFIKARVLELFIGKTLRRKYKIAVETNMGAGIKGIEPEDMDDFIFFMFTIWTLHIS